MRHNIDKSMYNKLISLFYSYKELKYNKFVYNLQNI